MSTTMQTAKSLGQKLTSFRQLLSKDEKDALDQLLIYFNSTVTTSSGGADLLKTANGKKVLSEMKNAIPNVASGRMLAITPTITTITITTTIASHPIITCSAKSLSITGTISR